MPRVVQSTEDGRALPASLITKGYGENAQIALSGFKTFKTYVIRIITRLAREGRSRADDIIRNAVDTYTITAKLIAINGHSAMSSMTSAIRGAIDRSQSFVIKATDGRIESVRNPTYNIIIDEVRVFDGKTRDARDKSDT